MPRHYIRNEDGTDQRDKDGHRTFWSDEDGDWNPEHHQTVYRETTYGNEEIKNVHYDPEEGEFHKK